MIEIPGYTLEEKVEIASRHLLPKQLTQHGLTSEQLRVPPQVLSSIAGSHTREAGVRNLERMIGAVCRAAAVKVYNIIDYRMCMCVCVFIYGVYNVHVRIN